MYTFHILYISGITVNMHKTFSLTLAHIHTHQHTHNTLAHTQIHTHANTLAQTHTRPHTHTPTHVSLAEVGTSPKINY